MSTFTRCDACGREMSDGSRVTVEPIGWYVTDKKWPMVFTLCASVDGGDVGCEQRLEAAIRSIGAASREDRERR